MNDIMLIDESESQNNSHQIKSGSAGVNVFCSKNEVLRTSSLVPVCHSNVPPPPPPLYSSEVKIDDAVALLDTTTQDSTLNR